jgi:drug/metabolite transporter (DMT)-like permease
VGWPEIRFVPRNAHLKPATCMFLHVSAPGICTATFLLIGAFRLVSLQRAFSRSDEPSKLAFAVMIGIPIIGWALAFPFIKIGLEYLSFTNLTLLRFCIVCPLLLAIVHLTKDSLTPLARRDVLPIFLLGFFGIIVYHLGLNYGEQYVSPGAASLIVATIPIFVLLLAAVYLDEPLTPVKIIGVIVSLFGVVILTVWGSAETVVDVSYMYGALAVLLAALMGAFYTIAGKKLLKHYTPLSLTLYAMLLGSLGLIPLTSPTLVDEAATLSLEGWGAIVFLGVVSTVVSYTLWLMVLYYREASKMSVYLYCVPILSTLVAYLRFGDAVTPFFIVGGALVIGGLLIVNSPRKCRRQHNS